jgi:hypothetical protein
MRIVKPFIAGFVATLVFHQGVLALLHVVGATPRAPFVMTPAPRAAGGRCRLGRCGVALDAQALGP